MRFYGRNGGVHADLAGIAAGNRSFNFACNTCSRAGFNHLSVSCCRYGDGTGVLAGSGLSYEIGNTCCAETVFFDVTADTDISGVGAVFHGALSTYEPGNTCCAASLSGVRNRNICSVLAACQCAAFIAVSNDACSLTQPLTGDFAVNADVGEFTVFGSSNQCSHSTCLV